MAASYPEESHPERTTKETLKYTAGLMAAVGIFAEGLMLLLNAPTSLQAPVLASLESIIAFQGAGYLLLNSFSRKRGKRSV